MRILVDVRLLSRGGQSGIEEYTEQLVSHILNLDRQNTYLLFYNGLRRKVPLPAQWRQAANTKIIDWHLPNNLLVPASKFFNFPKFDKLIKTDLIFSPHLDILRHSQAPRILTIHDLSFIHHPYFLSRKSRFWHWMQDYKDQAKKADLINTISEFSKKDIVETLKIPPEKIKVVHLGVNPIFKPKEIAALPSVARNDGENAIKNLRPYILYLGTVEPRKNIGAIIKAFNLLKTKPEFHELKLVIAGKIKRSNLPAGGKDIIFLGQVKQEDRVLLYNLAELFVFPSFFEGFGLPPLEAQACGCPVVASNRASLPEVLGKTALLVDPWKVNDLAEAMEAVLLNKELKDKLVAAGLENVRRFEWERSATEILNIFKCVL